MPKAKKPVSYSLTASFYYPPGIPNPSSPSGPPPSHSDSPSGTSPRSRRPSIPRHWRRVTHTIVAVDLEESAEERRSGDRVQFTVKKQAVKEWLTQALAPYLQYEPPAQASRDCVQLQEVLDKTVSHIVKDKRLVENIWRLKKCQA